MAESKPPLSAGLIIVIAVGFLIRLYACWATAIIPPDGALYLYQAKMLVNGHWDRITGCGIYYLANLPIFIAGAYTIFHDWVIAAQSVSLVFGTATLVFVYLTLREFCDEQISCVASLVVAVTPVMVSRSADVVRGPVAWFFFSLGMYLFISHFRRRPVALYLLGSHLAFLMATWARIEGLLAIPVSLAYLAWASNTDRFRRCFYFLLPILVLSATILVLVVTTGKDISSYYRSGEVMAKLTAFADNYDLLRDQIKASINPDMPAPLRWFLPEARSTIWLVSAGVLLNRICEGVFYPYLIFYLFGLHGIRKRLRDDSRIHYFLLLIVAILGMLYLHTLETWMLFYRFIIFAILPGAVLAAFGVDTIRRRLCQVTNLQPATIIIGLGVLIVLASLPKNLQLRDPEKKVFRDIGYHIAALEGNAHGIKVSTSYYRHRWVSFYANMNVADPPCPAAVAPFIWSNTAGNLRSFVRQWQTHGVGYFLWEEKSWPNEPIDWNSEFVQNHLQLVGQWYHDDTGSMKLLKVKPF